MHVHFSRSRSRQNSDDQPPEVWFEEPDEALEVHSIAEVLLRIRTRDDFGQSRDQIHDRYAAYLEQYPRVLEKRERSAA